MFCNSCIFSLEEDDDAPPAALMPGPLLTSCEAVLVRCTVDINKAMNIPDRKMEIWERRDIVFMVNDGRLSMIEVGEIDSQR